MRRILPLLLILLAIIPLSLLAQKGSINPNHIWLRLQPGYTVSAMMNLLDLPHGGHIERPILLPEQSVRYSLRMMRVAPTGNIEEMMRAEEPLLRTAVVEYDGTLSPQEYCALILKNFPSVELATPIYRNKLQSIPNDPKLDQQSYLSAIEAKDAWDISFGDSTLLVGVSDSGVRTSHEDLQNSVAANSGEIPDNNKDDDGNGYIDDYKGYNITYRNDGTAADNVFHPSDSHGTRATGIICATGNNNKGICGIAGLCKFVPIKTEANSVVGYVDYGYESIVYAAIRGCKVLNCSWGNDAQVYNPIEQSIIDFAISRNVAIVVSAGNQRGIPTDPFFPAKYRGVLSVGETDFTGKIISGSSYGAHCSILAPGDHALTTDNSGDANYEFFYGTSSAAPVASGVVALVRAKYPNLTALQAIEHVRQSTRSVAGQNQDLEKFLPGMVNARRALEIEPFTMPSIRLHSYSLATPLGASVQNGYEGDTLQVAFAAKNYLGDGKSLRFSLSILDPAGNIPIEVIDTVVEKASISRDEEFSVATFRIRIKETTYNRLFFRVEIHGKNLQGDNYDDVALVEFFPARDFVTLRNNRIAYSLGNFGWIGTNAGAGSTLKGAGFSSTSAGNMMFRGGVMVTQASQSKARSGIGSDISKSSNELRFVSALQSSSSYILKLSDINDVPGDGIGVEIEQVFAIPQDSESIARVDMNITNKTTQSLNDIAVGYFFDWDITQLGDSSRVRLFPEAGLALSSMHSVAEMMERTSANPVVGAAAVVASGEGLAQAAGTDVSFIDGNFPTDKKIAALNSGVSIQSSTVGDVSMVVGVKYSQAIESNQRKTCRVCFGSADNATQLAERLKQCLLAAPVGVQEDGRSNKESGITVSPNPAGDEALVQIHTENESDDAAEVQLCDVLGNSLFTTKLHLVNGMSSLPLSTHTLANGMYLLRLNTAQRVYSTHLVVAR